MEYNDNSGNNRAYTEAYYEQYESTISNGEARIPICICVDTSSSMNFLNNDPSDYIQTNDTKQEDGRKVRIVQMKPGCREIRKIDRLHDVLRTMISRMQNNDIIARSAVICIITFNQFADCLTEFTDVSRIRQDSILDIKTGKDETNSSRGLNMALGRLDQFISINSNAGNDRYTPILIFMSDGIPTDGEEADKVRELVRKRSMNGILNVIPISICGDNDGKNWLRGLSKDDVVYNMDNEREFNLVFNGITERIKKTTLLVCIDENNSSLVEIDDANGTVNGSDNSLELINFLNEDFFKNC